MRRRRMLGILVELVLTLGLAAGIVTLALADGTQVASSAPAAADAAPR